VTATRALLAAPGCEQPRAAPPPRWPEDRRWRNLLFGGLHFGGAGFSQAQDAGVERCPTASILRLLRL